MSNKSRYKRLTDLFTVGEVVQPDPEDPGALLWVQKLNGFELDESRKEAQVVRARTVLALRQEGSDEVNALTDAVSRLDKDRLIAGIVSSLYTKHVGEASAAIAADPEWAERMDIMERTDRNAVPEDERRVVDKINADYLDTLNQKILDLDKAERERLEDEDDEAVRRAYIDSFIESRAAAVFLREMRYVECFYGVRMCDAKQKDPENGNYDWDHKECSHERLYDDIEEARQMPDELLNQFTRAFDRINVPARTAKGLARRGASSGPSRQLSEPEASAPSTPEVMSPEQAGTSESPSTTP